MMPLLHPAAFFDRDGVINVDTGFPHKPADLVLTPSAAQAIARLNRANCLTIVVTNQSGVARGLFDLAAVACFHTAIQVRLAKSGAQIDAFYVAPYHPDGIVVPFNVEHDDRKPGAGMIVRAIAEWSVDPGRSVLFGDRSSDMEAARRAGVEGVRVAANTCDLDAAVQRWLARR